MFRNFVVLFGLCASFSFAAVAQQPPAQPSLEDVLAAVRAMQAPPAGIQPAAMQQAHAQPIYVAPPQPQFVYAQQPQQPQLVYATPQPYAPPPPAYPYYYAQPQTTAALPPLDKQFFCGKPEEPKPDPLSEEAKANIKNQIAACWIPAYAQHAPAIEMTLSLNDNGTVSNATIADSQMELYGKDMLFHSLVDSLRRAAFHPRCTPLQGLDKEKYESWKEVALTFNVNDAPR